jgi:hypothetical protein
MLATLVTASLGSSVLADGMYVVRDYRPFCRSRITEICKVPAGPMLGMPTPQGAGVPAGQAITLQCRDWEGGRVFTDQAGRRWQLASPVPLRQAPQQLTGTLFRGPDGQSLFMTSDRLVFVELPRQ